MTFLLCDASISVSISVIADPWFPIITERGKDCLTRRREILLSSGSNTRPWKIEPWLGPVPSRKGELSPLSYFIQFSSVQSLSGVWLFTTPWTVALQASLLITNFQSLLNLMFIALVMPSSHLILCHPLLLPPSIFSSIRVFSSESVLYIRWPKDWSFSFSISPSSEHSGLISFRIDWLDLLAVQGTLRSLQHHCSKASMLWRSAFFIVQLSHPYVTTGKTIVLTRRGFVLFLKSKIS